MARREKFEVTYVSNSTNKTTQTINVIASDKHEARAKIETRGNKVLSVVYRGAVLN